MSKTWDLFVDAILEDVTDQALVEYENQTIEKGKLEELTEDVDLLHEKLRIHRLRRIIEDQIITDCFMDRNYQRLLADTLLKDNNYVYDLFKRFFAKGNLKFPYNKDDFARQIYDMGNDVTMIRQEFPEPEGTRLFYRCYLLYDKNFKYAEIYDVRTGSPDGAKHIFAFDGTPLPLLFMHSAVLGYQMNYGLCNLDDEADILKRILAFSPFRSCRTTTPRLC